MRSNKESFIKKKVLSTVLLIVVLLILLVLSIQSASDSYILTNTIKGWLGIEATGSLFRRLLHIPEYLILGLVLTWFGNNHGYKRWALALLGISIGITEEVLKGYIPTRDCDLLDIVMDIIGLILAYLLVFLMIWVKRLIYREKK